MRSAPTGRPRINEIELPSTWFIPGAKARVLAGSDSVTRISFAARRQTERTLFAQSPTPFLEDALSDKDRKALGYIATKPFQVTPSHLAAFRIYAARQERMAVPDPSVPRVRFERGRLDPEINGQLGGLQIVDELDFLLPKSRIAAHFRVSEKGIIFTGEGVRQDIDLSAINQIDELEALFIQLMEQPHFSKVTIEHEGKRRILFYANRGRQLIPFAMYTVTASTGEISGKFSLLNHKGKVKGKYEFTKRGVDSTFHKPSMNDDHIRNYFGDASEQFHSDPQNNVLYFANLSVSSTFSHMTDLFQFIARFGIFQSEEDLEKANLILNSYPDNPDEPDSWLAFSIPEKMDIQTYNNTKTREPFVRIQFDPQAADGLTTTVTLTILGKNYTLHYNRIGSLASTSQEFPFISREDFAEYCEPHRLTVGRASAEIDNFVYPYQNVSIRDSVRYPGIELSQVLAYYRSAEAGRIQARTEVTFPVHRDLVLTDVTNYRLRLTGKSPLAQPLSLPTTDVWQMGEQLDVISRESRFRLVHTLHEDGVYLGTNLKNGPEIAIHCFLKQVFIFNESKQRWEASHQAGYDPLGAPVFMSNRSNDEQPPELVRGERLSRSSRKSSPKADEIKELMDVDSDYVESRNEANADRIENTYAYLLRNGEDEQFPQDECNEALVEIIEKVFILLANSSLRIFRGMTFPEMREACAAFAFYYSPNDRDLLERLIQGKTLSDAELIRIRDCFVFAGTLFDYQVLQPTENADQAVLGFNISLQPLSRTFFLADLAQQRTNKPGFSVVVNVREDLQAFPTSSSGGGGLERDKPQEPTRQLEGGASF